MADYIIIGKNKEHEFDNIDDAREFAIKELMRTTRQSIDLEKRLYDREHYGNDFLYGRVYVGSFGTYFYTNWKGNTWILKKDGTLGKRVE